MYCCSTLQRHIRLFNNEYNSYSNKIFPAVDCTLKHKKVVTNCGFSYLIINLLAKQCKWQKSGDSHMITMPLVIWLWVSKAKFNSISVPAHSFS